MYTSISNVEVSPLTQQQPSQTSHHLLSDLNVQFFQF
jgi:hypothetical protein